MSNGQPYPVVFDNHFHLRHDGDFLEAVRKFSLAGGTAINLTNLPDHSLGTEGYYEKIFDRTLGMAEVIRRETEVFVMVTLGPYPMDYFFFREHGKDAKQNMFDGIDLAARLYSQGKITAMGEIGLPHFKVEPGVMESIEEVLSHAFEVCGDMGIPVVLHTGDLSPFDVESLCSRAVIAGMKCSSVVKHHGTPDLLGNPSGMIISLPATRDNARQGARSADRFMIETDYIDDPLDRNKFLPPDSVPKRAAMIRQEYENWEKILESIFVETPKIAYSLVPSGIINK